MVGIGSILGAVVPGIAGAVFGGSGGSSQTGSSVTSFRPPGELTGAAFGPSAGVIPTTNQGIVGTPQDVLDIDRELATLEGQLAAIPQSPRIRGGGGNRQQVADLQRQIQDLQVRRAQILEQQGAGTFEDINPFQGFAPEAIGAFERGAFEATPSPLFGQAIEKLLQASQQQNPLQEAALSQAEKFIAGDTGSTDRLQSNIDAVLKRIGDDAQLRTATDFNLAGRFGSPAQQGVLADRITDRASPIVGELLARDEARREDLQSQFTQAAPALGLGPRTQLIDEAQLLSQAGGLEDQGQLSEFDALTRLGSLLGFPGSFGGQQVSPIFQNKTAGRLGGALAGLDLASSLGSAFGGGGSSFNPKGFNEGNVFGEQLGQLFG